MMKFLKFLILSLTIVRCNFAAEGNLEGLVVDSGCPVPWFTGPILAPSAHVIPGGYVNIEPYVFYTVFTGFYDEDWKTNSVPNFTTVDFEFLVYMGINSWIDFQVVPKAFWYETQGVSTLTFADLPVQLDFQVVNNESNPAIPGLKLYVRETFPTGPYQKGDPERLFTDVTGFGSFETTIGLVTSSLIEFGECHFLDLRLNGFVRFGTTVPIKGISSYGGAVNTDGTIHPGLEWGGIFAFQYNLTRNWAIACDLEGIFANETTFEGFKGFDSPLLGFPKSIAFSIAPAIEYNFNENVGIIAGTWFTFAGQRTPQFFSGVIAINYYGPISNPSKRHKFRTQGGSGGSSAGSGGR